MSKGKGKKIPLTFEQKMREEDPEFCDSVDGLSIQQLEARIANYQKDLQDSEEHKANNEALRDAKTEVEMIAGPYRDVKKAIQKKTRYIISTIRSKGGV